jgi:protein O-mannosyl-transferase
MEDAAARMPAPPAAESARSGWTLGLAVAYAVVALWMLGPARGGEFLSDDLPNVLYNPYVQELSLANLKAILDPRGEPAALTFNYAPVHMLALALEWRAFGEDVRGFHVVNALVHALAAALLAALLSARGLPFAAAALGGAFFLVHPANVEPASWIFQIKTTGALAFALGALLAHPRRPALALVLFALGLLTKASAAFALPMAIAFTAQDRDWRRRAGWLAAWAALLVPYAFVELSSLGRAEAHPPLDPDPLVAARTLVALAGRYLAMALTGTGVAPGHHLALARSPLDAWFLGGLAALALLAARAVYACLRRREEAAWWIGAAAGYLPVAQIGMRFLVPMADRYLYFALPGLIGGAAFLLRDLLARRGPAPTRTQVRAALAFACVALVALAARSHGQARAWRSAATLALASAAAHPDGLAAQLLAAQRAALQGDAASAVAALREATRLGYDRVDALAEAPIYDAIRPAPAFQQLLRDQAQAWVDRSLTLAHPGQADLAARAEAQLLLGDAAGAAASVDEGLRMGGPLDARLRALRARIPSVRPAS